MKKAIEIIYENEDFYMVVKPQNLPIQRDKSNSSSLITLLENELEFSRGIDSPFIGLVHRLDRNTGGLCIIAKSQKSLSSLSEMFRMKNIKKTYLAVVSGNPAEKATLTHNLLSDSKSNFVTVDEKNGKSSSLSYKLLGSIQPNDERFSTHHLEYCFESPLNLLEVELHTGRQHQIRVQLSHEGLPIIGDAKYGIATHTAAQMALWAYKLEFECFRFAALPLPPRTDNNFFMLFSDILQEL